MGGATSGDTDWPRVGWSQTSGSTHGDAPRNAAPARRATELAPPSGPVQRPESTGPASNDAPAGPAPHHAAVGQTRSEAGVVVRRETEPDAAVLAAWDGLVARTEGTDVTQLSAWARIRGLAGYRPLYVLAFAGGELVGGALMLRRRLAGLLSIGYLPYGPVVAGGLADRAPVVAALVGELVALSRRHRLMFIQPPEGAEDVSAALLARGFRPSTAGIAPAGSYRLDLTPPLEQIRAGFSKRLKSWTNRWAAKGVRVRHGDESDLALLVELMAETGRRQGFAPPPLDYVRTLYRELDTTGEPNVAVALFVGEVDGVAVSADVVTACAGMVRGRLGGFRAHGEAGKLSVPAAVRWRIIQWAKQRGYHYLDFGGLPEAMLADMLERGIHTSDDWPSAQRSKLQFNGRPFRYPTAVERVHPAPLRLAYDWATTHSKGRRVLTVVKDVLRGNRGHVTAAAQAGENRPGEKYH